MKSVSAAAAATPKPLQLLVLLLLLVYYSIQAAVPLHSPAYLLTDAKDESAEIGSPGFKPLDARALGES
jgi:hypothetical protein